MQLGLGELYYFKYWGPKLVRRGSKRDDLLGGFTSGNDREQLVARLSRNSITYPTRHEEEFIHGCGPGCAGK